MTFHKFIPHSMWVFIVYLMTIPPLCAQTHHNNPESKEDTGQAAPGTSIPGPYDQALLEEVIVVGQRSVFAVRRAMFATQDLLYDTFNKLNDDNEYDMICLKEARTGSQIKYTVCRPRFLMEAVSRATEDWRSGEGASVNMAEMRRKSKRQEDLMAELANKNPEFLNLLKKRLALKKTYELKRKQCGWNIKCPVKDPEEQG